MCGGGLTDVVHLPWMELGQRKDAAGMGRGATLPATREGETTAACKERSYRASRGNALPRVLFLLLPRAELKILELS